jgi:hypothetical protein
MKYPIIIILVGFVFYVSSFFLNNYGNQLREDAMWGKLPEEYIGKGDNFIKISGYIKETGNYIAIGGEVWLVVVLIGKIRKGE